jgi:hypothetical protein
MRSELDEALARMARREDLTRRQGADPPDGVPARHWQLRSNGPAGTDELLWAVRGVVERHPGMTVTLAVTEGATTSSVRVHWSSGSVALTTQPIGEHPRTPLLAGGEAHGPAAARPRPALPTRRTGGQWTADIDSAAGARSAARLADLIRQDPSLLDRADERP